MAIRNKRVCAGVLALLQLWTTAAFAASCPAPSSLGGVFSTLPGGSINFYGDAGGACNITFYASTKVNTGALTQPGSTSGNACKTFMTQDQATANKTTTTLSAHDQVITGPTLPAYSESPESLILEASVNGLTYKTASNANPVQVRFADGVGTITTALGSTLSITLNGSENGFHTYTLPAGDYGEIHWQNMNADQFGGFIFAGPIRARYIQGYNCGDQGAGHGVPSGFGIGLSFAQDVAGADPYYRQQNYINRMELGDGCSLNVAGPGRTTLNILGKVSVDSPDAPAGFKLGQSNSCVNYTYPECKKETKLWADMESQHPERLQFNLYNGDFQNSDRLSFAAGVYVPNGDFKMTAASGTTIVGEVLAKRVYNTQNNGGSQFFSKSTAVAVLQTSAYSLTPPVTSSAKVRTGDYVYRAMQNDYRADGVTPGTSGHLKAFTLNANSTHSTEPAWDAAALMSVSERSRRIVTETENWAASTDTDFQALDSTASCVIDPRASACRGANDPRDPTSLVGVPWRVSPQVVGDSVLFAADDGILYSVNKSSGALNWGWIPRQILAIATQTGSAVTMASRHPWGQFNGMKVVTTSTTDNTQVEKTYITGTALGGQLHFSIEVSADGSQLRQVKWLDYAQGEYSPGSLAPYMDNRSGNENSWPGVVGRPFGGAAPTANLANDGRVAYVRGNKLYIRNIDGSDTPTGRSLSTGAEAPPDGTTVTVPTITSGLAYRDDASIFFGAGDGKVYESSSSGTLKSSPAVSGLNLGTDPIWYVNSTRLVSASGNSLLLLAQSARRVNILRFANDSWSRLWWTGLSGTGLGESSATTVSHVRDVVAADNAYLSAPANIQGGSVIVYYTTKASECSTSAYVLGPLKLEDGSSAIGDSQFKLNDMTSDINRIGDGEATGGTLINFNGKNGVLTGSSGTSTSTGQTAAITNKAGTSRQRLNWRELTNFF